MKHKARLVWVVLIGCANRAPQRTTLTIANATPVPPNAPLQTPRSAVFGTPDETGVIVARQAIVLEHGQVFGWRIEVPCVNAVHYREVLKLPKPGNWSRVPASSVETTISADQRTSVTTEYAACVDGVVEHRWNAAEGDPPGLWMVTVELEGVVAQTFRATFE